jgi:hypothetical protein
MTDEEYGDGALVALVTDTCQPNAIRRTTEGMKEVDLAWYERGPA